MNTFIANKATGNKIDFIEGRATFAGLNSLYEAKYCTCNAETENVSEILDLETAEVVALSYEDKE